MDLRILRWTLLAAVTFASSSAHATTYCGTMRRCPTDNTVVTLRTYHDVRWTLFELPTGKDSLRVAFTNNENQRMVNQVMAGYSALDQALPYDDTAWSQSGGGADLFQWGWVDQATLRSDPTAETFAPASIGLNWTDCHVTTSMVMFAWNPGAGVSTRQWVADYCPPPCTQNGYGPGQQLDYYALAMHEFGHALGLSHNSSSSATMYYDGSSNGTASDTLKRTLLGCEADYLAAIYRNNPAARVDGLRFIATPGGLRATWDAVGLSMTASFVVKAAPAWDRPFTHLVDVPLHGDGLYDVDLPVRDDDRVYRLYEVSVHGDTIPQGADMVSQPIPGSSVPSDFDLLSKVDSINASFRAYAAMRALRNGPVAMTGRKHLIFVRDSLRAPADFKAEMLPLLEGLETEVITVEEIGGEPNIRPTIAARLPQGGTYELLGGLNDSLSVDGRRYRNNPALYGDSSGHSFDPRPLDPKRDQIRGWFMAETKPQDAGLGVIQPYTWRGDGEYSRFTGNVFGLSDTLYGGSREPADNLVEAWKFVYKSLLRNQNQSAPVAFTSYEHDLNGCLGHLVKEYTDAAKLGFPDYVRVLEVRDSPEHPLTALQRDEQLSSFLNGGLLALFMQATGSGRNNPAGFLNAYLEYDPEVALQYNPYQLPVVVSASCLTNGLHATYLPSGPPSSKRMVMANGRGALLWVGPGNGTDLRANFRVLQKIKQTWLARPGLQFGRVVAIALNEHVREFPGDSATVATYQLMGDASIVVPVPSPPVVSVDGPNGASVRFAAWPNPAHGEVVLSFTLPSRADVDLSVYDLAGRRVATIVRGEQDASIYTLRWRPSVASSTNFIQLRVGTEVRHAKVTWIQ